MYYYTYKIILTNPESPYYNHFYVGKRQSIKEPEKDYYRGSSSILRKDGYFKKYPRDYKKEIICTYNSIEELNEAEKILVSIHINNPYNLNIAPGGMGGDTYNLQSPEGQKLRDEKVSLANKGRKKIYYDYNTYIQRLSNSLKGMQKSWEWRNNISKGKTGIPLSEEHKQHIKEGSRHLSIPRSSECKEKISQRLKEYYTDEDNRINLSNKVKEAMNNEEIKSKCRLGGLHSTGLIWIYKGEQCKRVAPNELESYLNDGYIKGRKKFRK